MKIAGMVPVVWVCGAPGVGKSVTARELFLRTTDVGYLDIDQVGMLYPGQEADEDGPLLQLSALQALRSNFTAAGTDTLLVSGVADPVLADDPGAPVPRADVRYCLLTVDPDILRRRVLERGWETSFADESVAEQEALVAAGFADVVIETTSMSVGEVADRLAVDVKAGWKPPATEVRPPPQDPPPPNAAIFVTGPRVSGCSTIGFTLARRAWDSGTRTGFADLGQLAFWRRPDGDGHSDLGLGLANLASLRAVFARLGAERFVANGHLAARPAPDTTVVRLRASAETLRDHLDSRLGDNEARLTGDDLANATSAHQEEVLSETLAEQDLLERAGVGDLVIDVSGRTPEDVVSEIETFLA